MLEFPCLGPACLGLVGLAVWSFLGASPLGWCPKRLGLASRGFRLWEISDFYLFSGPVAQESLWGAGMGLISSGPFCLLPLSAWWSFVYFAVVASPLYRVGFIGGQGECTLKPTFLVIPRNFFFVYFSILILGVSLTYLFIYFFYPHYFYFIIIIF